MMSITNRSRILALVLAVAMILSLVPVMAAAESGDSIGYVTVTYPESGSEYKIKAVYYNADGKKDDADIAVAIMPDGSSDPADLIYYNIIKTENGVIEFTVNLDGEATVNTAAADKYVVEFITASIDKTRNTAHIFYNGEDLAKAKKARDDAANAATSLSNTALRQKFASVMNSATVYNKYVAERKSKNFNNAAIKNVISKIEAKTFAEALSGSDLVKKVEEATVSALFDVATKQAQFVELLNDSNVIDVIADSNISDEFAAAKKRFDALDEDDVTNTIESIADYLLTTTGILGNFDNLSDTADNLTKAINAKIKTEDKKDEVSENITNNNSFGGSNAGSYVPPTPSNPVIHVTNVFTDVDANYWWLINPLQELYINGFVNGRTATTFAPAENITRAEFLKILLLELNMVDTNATVAFSDVNANDWFYSYVASGANRGIVKGRSETEFAPNALITREEICIMTMRAVRACNIDLGSNAVAGAFTDEADIASYAVEDVHALKAAGIVSGRDTGAFDPKANATRAEAVKILYGVYEKR